MVSLAGVGRGQWGVVQVSWRGVERVCGGGHQGDGDKGGGDSWWLVLGLVWSCGGCVL